MWVILVLEIKNKGNDVKMFILKIHTDYGYEGHDDYNLAISSSKERLEDLVKDFLEKLPKIKKKSALDTAEWDYNNKLKGVIRNEAIKKLREDVWLSFQGDSALDFLEIMENWDEDCSEFDIEEVEVV